MALGYAFVRRLTDVGKTIVDITLDGSYASGGYALSNPSLGFAATPDMIDCDVKTGQGFTPVWDTANNKLKMFKSAAVSGAHAECVAGDLSTSVVVRAEVTGAYPLT